MGRGHHGHLCSYDGALSVLCLPPPLWPNTSAAVCSLRNRLRELPPKAPRRPSQGLERGCGERAVRWH